MINIKNKLLLKILILFSFFALSFAFYVEFILNHKPCILCKIERVPYLLVFLICSLSIMLNKFDKLTLFLTAIIFFVSSIISFYHWGIEESIFTEALICNLESETKTLSTDKLLQELKNNPISCKDVTFKIAGFSLASINAVSSIVLSAIILLKLKINEKNK